MFCLYFWSNDYASLFLSSNLIDQAVEDKYIQTVQMLSEMLFTLLLSCELLYKSNIILVLLYYVQVITSM